MDITSIVSGILTVINRLFPDQTELQKAAINLELTKIQADLQLATQQAQVNAVDAAADDKYQSRWRPTAAWMCVGALGIGVIVKIIIPTLMILLPIFGYHDLSTLKSIVTQLNALDIEMFNTMLWGLLGLGAYRTYEKTRK